MNQTERRKKIKGDEELSALSDDLDKAKALDILASSEGGKLLADSLIADIVATVESFAAHYEKATMQEFVAWGAGLSQKIEMFRTLRRAKDASRILKEELDKALSE